MLKWKLCISNNQATTVFLSGNGSIHEQVNKSSKGDDSAVGPTENPAALRRWMISGPELSRIVAEVENKLCDVSNSSSKRHEQVPHVQMIR